jgi:hypothetical protein
MSKIPNFKTLQEGREYALKQLEEIERLEQEIALKKAGGSQEDAERKLLAEAQAYAEKHNVDLTEAYDHILSVRLEEDEQARNKREHKRAETIALLADLAEAEDYAKLDEED